METVNAISSADEVRHIVFAIGIYLLRNPKKRDSLAMRLNIGFSSREKQARAVALYLLRHPEYARYLADEHGVAIPFALVLDEELDEIDESRKLRKACGG
jgi:hypothetical protein